MPDVKPFRGWRYDIGVAGPLDGLICPPYDIITPHEAARLLSASPQNAIRLELGPGSTDPSDPENRYETATRTLERWVAAGIVRQDPVDSLYVYEQEFMLDGARMRRLCFLAAVRLTPFSSGEVLPHEATLSAPKADRLALLAATRANISPIYALCDGGLPGVDEMLSVARGWPADAAATDGDGCAHRLWVVPDPAAAARVACDLAAHALYIADGHHRYETALAYADAHPGSAGVDGPGYVLMAVTPVDDPGLIVLPTHRLLRDLDDARLADALSRLDTLFEVTTLDGVAPAAALVAAIGHVDSACAEGAIGLYTHTGACLLRPKMGAAPVAACMDRLDPALRRLDVSLLHVLLLEELLGFTPDELRRQANIDYTRDAADAVRLVDEGAYQAAALLAGTPPSDVVAAARAGAHMPQKSTYFYPKVATGLVMRRMTDVGSRESQ